MRMIGRRERRLALVALTGAMTLCAADLARAASPYDTGPVGATAPRRAGQYSCAANERRTHLERKNCGNIRR